MMNGLTKKIAEHVVNRVQEGQPPECGVQFFTAGLNPYLTILEREYFSSFLKQGGSSFKLVVGTYGGGKTHFLYCVREMAWMHNFAVSYVNLSNEASPFYQLDLVYATIIKGIMRPLSPEELMSGHEKGLDSFIKAWVAQKQAELIGKGVSGDRLRKELLASARNLCGIESTSFNNAVCAAFRAVVDKKDEEFRTASQWLKGEGYDRKAHSRLGILQKIDKTTAFSMIRSLLQWVRQIGYSGLAILFDEVTMPASVTTKQRERHLSNLREVIDECGHMNVQGAIIFYAVPDLLFLDGKTVTYEALNQRLDNVFERLNPTGVKIELDKVLGNTEEEAIPFLTEVGRKLAGVYARAKDHEFDGVVVDKMINDIAVAEFKKRFADISYRRAFVEKAITSLSHLHHAGVPPSLEQLTLK
jgi:hypothetical protein